MRLVVEVANLNRILSFVRGCVPSKSTLPILQHVLFCGSGSTLTVRATNLEREAEASCPAQMDDGGFFTLPGEMLCGIVAGLPQGSQICFERAGNRIRATSGSSKFTLSTLDPQDFPALNVALGEAPISFPVSAQGLSALISDVSFASEKDLIIRPQLYGVHIFPDNGRLVALSSDEKRLARQDIECPSGAESMPPILVPLDGVQKIVAILRAIDGPITMKVGPAVIEFATETLRFTSKLMDYALPEPMKKIPKPKAANFTVHPVAFRNAIERAQQVYDHSSIKIKHRETRLEAADGVLVVYMGDEALDAAREEVDAGVQDAKSLCIDATYLAEMLRLWPEDGEIDVYQESAGKPIFFSSRKYPSRLVMLGQMKPRRQSAARAQAEAA